MRADRLLSILLLLQGRGRMTARALAEELEVSERTIYRDIDALSAAGVPVYAERGPGGGCALLDGYKTNLTGLTESEAQALFLASLAGPLADLGLGKAVEGAMLKLAAALPSIQRQEAERVRRRIHLDSNEWFQPAEGVPYLALLQEALWHERRLQITYLPVDGRLVGRLVEPYGLVAKGSTWYLIAGVVPRAVVYAVSNIKAARREIRVYRVSRVRHAELTGERFEWPQDFSLEGYWREWCRQFQSNLPPYVVRLRLAAGDLGTLAQLYGEEFRGRIRDTGRPDEDGRVTIELVFESGESAHSHVLGLGTLVETLEPEELRARLLESAARVVDLYARLDESSTRRHGDTAGDERAEGRGQRAEKVAVAASTGRTRRTRRVS